jgi:hypothetical protein
MGDFSRATFEKLKHYVGVRLQQGVPVVDADWNEQEDIRKYELQTFLKWFVGNGTPAGNDGFRISSTALPDDLPDQEGTNDFIITGGDGTPDGAGRFLVEGWEVVNESDLLYTQQPLFNNADLAAKWGVAPLLPLTEPTTGSRQDTVYLDIWEREVDANEDSTLINPAIGVETCVRRKREWVVRVAESSATIPSPPPGHVFCRLADLVRGTCPAYQIQPNDLTDRRQRLGLNLGNVVERLAKLEKLLFVESGIGGFSQGSKSGTPTSGTFAKIAELTTMRPGRYKVETYHTVPGVVSGQPTPSGVASQIYVNDVESPDTQEHQTTQGLGSRTFRGSDFVTVETGDKIQIYARKLSPNNSHTGLIAEMEILISNPLHPAVL